MKVSKVVMASSSIAYVRNDGGNLKFMTDNGNSTGLCVQAGGGFVGINTMAPASNLHVYGDALISDTLKVTNLSVLGGTIQGFAASATTDTTNAANITSGTLRQSVIPNTGVQIGTYGTTSNVSIFSVQSDGRLISASSVPIQLQPINVTGLAQSATVDTTNATNITTGLLPQGRFPTTGVTAGTYPANVYQFPTFTVQSDGRITNVVSTNIAINASVVGGLTTWATSNNNVSTNAPPTLYGLNIAPNASLYAAGSAMLNVTGGAAVTAGMAIGKSFAGVVALDVSGDQAITGTLTATNLVSTNHTSCNLTIMGSIHNPLSVIGPATFSCNAIFSGAVTFMSGALDVSGGAALMGPTSIGKPTVYSGVLDVSGGAALSGGVALGKAYVGTVALDVSGAGAVSGRLDVSGGVSLVGPTSIGKATVNSGVLDVSGGAALSGGVALGKAYMGAVALDVSGAGAVSGRLDVSGSVSLMGTTSIGKATVNSGVLDVSGGAALSGGVALGKAYVGAVALDVSGAGAFSGRLDVSGSVSHMGPTSIGKATVN